MNTADYKYPHDQLIILLTKSIAQPQNKIYYNPTEQGREKTLKERLDKLWTKRHKK
jgi:putative ATPase